MPLERREAALQRWNRTRWLFPLRIVFTLVKILSHYVFYAMVSKLFAPVLVLLFLQLLGILLVLNKG
jgi:hypothetical protein